MCFTFRDTLFVSLFRGWWGVAFFFCPVNRGTYFFQKTVGLTTCFTVGRIAKADRRKYLSAVTNFTRRDGSSFCMVRISFNKKSSAIVPYRQLICLKLSFNCVSVRSRSISFRPSMVYIVYRKERGREKGAISFTWLWENKNICWNF